VKLVADLITIMEFKDSDISAPQNQFKTKVPQLAKNYMQLEKL